SGGVAQVNVSGGQPRAIMVDVDPSKLQAYGLTLADLSRRIGQENVSVPAGVAQEGKTQYNLRAVGYFQSLDELRRLPLTNDQG
ncbi:efflux RND transporter permease subunit, partial [Acinetobacter baumannii]